MTNEKQVVEIEIDGNKYKTNGDYIHISDMSPDLAIPLSNFTPDWREIIELKYKEALNKGLEVSDSKPTQEFLSLHLGKKINSKVRAYSYHNHLTEKHGIITKVESGEIGIVANGNGEFYEIEEIVSFWDEV